MVARIFKSSKTAMQSGTGNADQWFLEFEQKDQKSIDPVMSQIGSSDTTSQIKLKFGTKEEATLYAKKNNLLFFIDEGSEKKMNIRKNGYGDNFDYNRKRPWTHQWRYVNQLALQPTPQTNLIKFKFTTNLSYDTYCTTWPRSSAGQSN